MIDLGRKHDLAALNATYQDKAKHPTIRRGAYLAMEGIRRKMKDPVILKLRLRLIAATMAHDLVQTEKIGERLHDYENKHYPGRRLYL